MSIKIHPKIVLKYLIIFIIVLLIGNYLGLYIKFYVKTPYSFIDLNLIDKAFNLDYEKNIPSLYATVTLILTAFLLFIIAKFHKNSKTPFIPWYLLSAIFCFLSLDEFLSIHERLIDPFRNYFSTSGLLYFAWIIPYFIFMLVIVIIFGKFLYYLPTHFRNLFLLSGLIFTGGAIGMEMIGGKYVSTHDDNESLIFYIITSFEEFLEMFAISIFIYSLLLYISTHFPENNFKVI